MTPATRLREVLAKAYVDVEAWTDGACAAFWAELSRRESQLLEHFLRHPDEPQTRPMIFDRVWGYQFDTGTNLVDVYINYLRKKLRELGLDPIETLRGVGYVLDRKHCEGTR